MASSSVAAKSIKEENDEKNFVPSNEFVLQKHAAFFDRNHDGVIYPWETYKGFRAIGIDIATSTLAALFINIGLSGKTRPGKFPNLLFPIQIRNIQRGKHGSDTGVYDSEGRFVPSKFEEIFIKHAHTYPDALTEKELKKMLKDNRQPKNVSGWIAALTEWRLLFSIAKDKNGLLQKDKVRAVYDGSLFEQMEIERSASKNKGVNT